MRNEGSSRAGRTVPALWFFGRRHNRQCFQYVVVRPPGPFGSPTHFLSQLPTDRVQNMPNTRLPIGLCARIPRPQ